MSFFHNLKYIASFDVPGTKKVILREVVHCFLLAVPSAALLLILWELFSPLPDETKIWTIITIMCGVLLVQFFIASSAMIASNVWVYTISTKLRIEIGNRMQRFTLGFFKTRDP